MNPYRTLTELCLRHRVVLPTPRHWWLLPDSEVRTGEINALHCIRGRTVATNGILVAILDCSEHLTFGHKEWFIEDEVEHTGPVQRDSKASRRLKIEYV